MIRGKLLSALFLLLFPIKGNATVLSKYSLDGNLYDSSGNALTLTVGGAGTPIYLTSLPQPIEGTQSIGGLSSTSYLNVPATGWPTGSTGSIAASFFATYQQIGTNNNCTILSGNTANGDFMINYNWSSAQFVIRVPSSTGSWQFAFNQPYFIFPGRYYRVMMTWSGSTFKLLLMDHTSGQWGTIYTQTEAATFGAGSWTHSYIGNPGFVGGTILEMSVDDVVATDQYLTNGDSAFSTFNQQYIMADFGASWSAGYTCNVGPTCANGAYWQLQNDCASGGKNLYLTNGNQPFTNACTTFDTGTLITPWWDGVSGRKSADVLSDIQTRSRNEFLTPTANCKAILWFDQVYNDIEGGVLSGTSQANVAAEVVSLTATVPGITIYGFLPSNRGDMLPAYKAAFWYAITSTGGTILDGSALAYNYCDVPNSGHPDAPSYVILGDFLYHALFPATPGTTQSSQAFRLKDIFHLPINRGL